MSFVNGVNLLPATGEFTYATTPTSGARRSAGVLQPIEPINSYSGPPSGYATDLEFAIAQLQEAFPDCRTVAVVCSWFFDSTAADICNVYPSTTYIGGEFQAGGVATSWRCSGLTEQSTGVLIPISQTDGSFTYGGTPSDQSIVECIGYLKSRGLRTVFYPFLLGDIPGSNPWRGRITFPSDVSSAAAAAVAAFLGSASRGDFARDSVNQTVAYAGPAADWTYRRMILHYANLCVIAGGVDLFLLGSELRGLETLRGPSWTRAGTLSGGKVVWDYPFVAGLVSLAADVRAIFDGAGLTKNFAGLNNLVSYAADWSTWMGYQHPGADGQWPHLDALWADPNIDLVCFDNYLPLSDWTTAWNGGQDALDWSADPPSSWPPSLPAGLGLAGKPTLYSRAYLKANIEGGEKFNWFYFDGGSSAGLDPSGSDLRVTRPVGDRLAQTRQPYFAGQEILANKQVRWWWNNIHHAVYDAGDGFGWIAHGAPTKWAANAKPVVFTEYGFPSNDRATNQPNVFFTGNSSESATAYWSIWNRAEGGVYLPRRDQNLQLLALQAFHEYWFTDTPSRNETVAGVRMIEPAFCSIWNWDARPFPTFPNRSDVWGDTGAWEAGNWLSGKGPFLDAPVAEEPPAPGVWPAFPTLEGQGWSVIYRPEFATGVADCASGRAARAARMSAPLFEIEISFDILRMAAPYAELQALIGFIGEQLGRKSPFAIPVPAGLQEAAVLCRFVEDATDLEEFMAQFWALQALRLKTVKSE